MGDDAEVEGWGWQPTGEDEDWSPKTKQRIGEWAEGDDMFVGMAPPCDWMKPDDVHDARLTVADQHDKPAMRAELLLMLGLVNEDDLIVKPLTEKQPEKGHRH